MGDEETYYDENDLSYWDWLTADDEALRSIKQAEEEAVMAEYIEGLKDENRRLKAILQKYQVAEETGVKKLDRILADLDYYDANSVAADVKLLYAMVGELLEAVPEEKRADILKKYRGPERSVDCEEDRER